MEIENTYCDFNLKHKQSSQSIHDDFIKKEIQNAVQKIANKEGYISYKIKNETICTNGGNYLGVLHEVDITGKTADGDKETNLFIKTIIQENGNYNIVSVTDAYNKEIYAYKELNVHIKELEDEADVPIEDKFKMAKSYNESNTNMIILENLAKKGFGTFHRMDVFSLKFAELALKELAKFHGIFYVVQHKKKDYFEQKLKPMKQPFNCHGNWAEFMINLCKMSSKPLEDGKKMKILNFIPKFLEKFPQYMEDKESVGCTVCHGDYRANNILMKSKNGEVIEVVPVDFQLLYYGNPLNDFFFLIFTGTDQEFRKKNLENLKNLYYRYLEDYLKYFEMEIEDIFPRKEFERQYKERLDYGLMITLFSMPFCFACDDSIPDFGKDELVTVSYKLDKKYEERVRGVVDDFIDWGYLNNC